MREMPSTRAASVTDIVADNGLLVVAADLVGRQLWLVRFLRKEVEHDLSVVSSHTNTIRTRTAASEMRDSK